MSQRRHLFLAAWLPLTLPFVLCVFDRAAWHLPPGFSVAPYVGSGAAVNNARSLHLSGASQRAGPWITYVGARGSGPQNVSGRCAPAPLASPLPLAPALCRSAAAAVGSNPQAAPSLLPGPPYR
jgi:hypothetical protein